MVLQNKQKQIEETKVFTQQNPKQKLLSFVNLNVPQHSTQRIYFYYCQFDIYLELILKNIIELDVQIQLASETFFETIFVVDEISSKL